MPPKPYCRQCRKKKTKCTAKTVCCHNPCCKKTAPKKRACCRTKQPVIVNINNTATANSLIPHDYYTLMEQHRLGAMQTPIKTYLEPPPIRTPKPSDMTLIQDLSYPSTPRGTTVQSDDKKKKPVGRGFVVMKKVARRPASSNSAHEPSAPPATTANLTRSLSADVFYNSMRQPDDTGRRFISDPSSSATTSSGGRSSTFTNAMNMFQSSYKGGVQHRASLALPTPISFFFPRKVSTLSNFPSGKFYLVYEDCRASQIQSCTT